MTDIPRITTVTVLPTPAPPSMRIDLDAIRKIVREELSANAALEAAARQALEALEAFLSDELRPYEAAKIAAALRAVLKEQA